jgi:uncharacterized protein YpuA (DUF1002 family)
MTEEEFNANFNDDLTRMREQLRFALNNLDSIRNRDEVKGRLENVYFTLDELCEQTKGEGE